MGRPLGQHFLRDRNIVRKIIEAAALNGADSVLEIGPGRGALTDELLSRAGEVTAVELDSQLAAALKATRPALKLVEGNILDIDLLDLLGTRNDGQSAAPRSWKVVANLPYYITTPIIEHLLCHSGEFLDYIVVMIQREVAERIATLASRDTSSLSYFVNYYAEVEYLFTVKPGCFSPPPQVDSAVLKLTMRRQPPVSAAPEQLFRVVRTAFQGRRKTLRRSLQGLGVALSGAQWDEVWEECGISSQRRPETLTLQDFSALTQAIYSRLG